MILPEIPQTLAKNRRSNSEFRIKGKSELSIRKLKTISNQQTPDSPDMLKSKSNINQRLKGSKKLFTEFNQRETDDEKHIVNDLIQFDSSKINIPSNVNNSKQSLVGEKAVNEYYRIHKNLRKICNKEVYLKIDNPITKILQILESLFIPPKRLQIIKQKGESDTLDLKYCGLGAQKHSQIVNKLLESLQYFKHIDLSYNGINFDTIKNISKSLSMLNSVNLSHNRIGKNGCTQLSEIFKHPKCIIEKFIIEANQINDIQACFLLTGLIEYTNLKILNLSNNLLGDLFAQKFSKALYTKKYSLQQLYLHWNELGARGVSDLFKVFSEHILIKVLDLSWNSLKNLKDQSLESLTKFFLINTSCLHLDISYCQIPAESARKIQISVEKNTTLIGFHFEGNHGYINSNGNLVLLQQQTTQYPMPIGCNTRAPRRIDGVNLVKAHNVYADKQTKKDICWICEGYCQVEFQINKNKINEECFLHLEFQEYRGVKLNEGNEVYSLKKMCPSNQDFLFFFTYQRNFHTASSFYEKIKKNQQVQYFKIGKVEYWKVLIKQFNIMRCPVKNSINSKYEIQITCRPRAIQNKIYLKNLGIKKKLVEKFEKMPYTLKTLPILIEPQYDEKQLKFYRKCIEFDIKNSKIESIVSPEELKELKQIMLKYYKYIWIIYMVLASTNCTQQGIYSIAQKAIIQFTEEVKITTRRMPISKILVKYFSAIATEQKGFMMRRPQFLELLLRITEQKWARKSSQIFKSPFYNQVKSKFQNNLTLKKSLEESGEIKQREVFDLSEGFQRVVKRLLNYHERYSPFIWKKYNYQIPDVLVVLEGYKEFLISLFNKMCRGREHRSIRGIYIKEFYQIFSGCKFYISRKAFKQAEIIFLYSKKLQIDDGKPYCLNLNQFMEALVRIADQLSLSPPYSNDQIFDSMQDKKRIPLVFRIEALFYELYKVHKDLQNKKLNKLFEKGMFVEELNIYIEIEKEKINKSEKMIDSVNSNFKVKFNQFERQQVLTLKQLLEKLQIKYENTYVARYSIVEELTQIDD